jgi:hypothetical protein
MKNDLDQFWIEVQLWFAGVYAQWDALSSDRQHAIVLGVTCLCSFLLVFVYMLKLRKAKVTIGLMAVAVAKLDAGNVLAQQRLTAMYNAAKNPIYPCGDGIVEDEEDEVVCGLSEDAMAVILDKIAEQQSAANRTLVDTVDHITNAHHEMHGKTMDTLNRMIDCIENGWDDSYDRDEDEDEED